MKQIFTLLVLIVLAGCSSFYYHPDQKTLKQANIFMKNGQTLENDSQFLNALNTYQEAYKRYSLLDQLDGKAHAMLAMTREYYKLGDMRNYTIWKDSVSSLINLNLPKMKDELNLLEIEISFRNQEYENVVILSEGFKNRPLQMATEFCSYRMLSKAKLNQSYLTERTYLIAETDRLAKLYNKHKLEEPSILAFAYYSIGYVYILQGHYKKSLKILNKAYRIDQSEENFSDIADDVYLMGYAYEQLEEHELAHNYYTRALEIGLQTNDQELQNRINDRLKNLTH